MIKQYKLRDYKFRLVLWVIALTVLGIMIIGSADSDVQSKQIIGLILGLIAMVIVSLIDYTWLLKFYWIFYFIGLAMLGAIMLVGRSQRCNQMACDWRYSDSAFRLYEDHTDHVLCSVFCKA